MEKTIHIFTKKINEAFHSQDKEHSTIDDLSQILVPQVKLEVHPFFDYYRLKCCMNWENKKNNITGRSAG
jgi:hypothetical protein